MCWRGSKMTRKAAQVDGNLVVNEDKVSGDDMKSEDMVHSDMAVVLARGLGLRQEMGVTGLVVHEEEETDEEVLTSEEVLVRENDQLELRRSARERQVVTEKVSTNEKLLLSSAGIMLEKIRSTTKKVEVVKTLVMLIKAMLNGSVVMQVRATVAERGVRVDRTVEIEHLRLAPSEGGFGETMVESIRRSGTQEAIRSKMVCDIVLTDKSRRIRETRMPVCL